MAKISLSESWWVFKPISGFFPSSTSTPLSRNLRQIILSAMSNARFPTPADLRPRQDEYLEPLHKPIRICIIKILHRGTFKFTSSQETFSLQHTIKVKDWFAAHPHHKELVLQNLRREMEMSGWIVDTLRVENVGTEDERLFLKVAEGKDAVVDMPPPYTEKKVVEKDVDGRRLERMIALCLVLYIIYLLLR